MEEIDLKELFDFIKDRLGLIVIITAAVSIIGCIYGLLIQTPMYKSYTTVVLSGSESSNTSITTTDITLNKNLINTYAEIVKSRRILDQVIENLDLDIKYGTLSSRVSVSALNNTEIIKITVNDEDPNIAMDIANETAKVFSNEIASLYKMDNVNILDNAIASENPHNINVLKQLVIYVLVGLILGLGVVFMIFYFDRTIKSLEQIEQKTKLPILGSVQDVSKGGKKK